MTKGLRVRAYDGSVVLSSEEPMPFILGTITTTAGVSGSFTIPDAGLSAYFAYITGSSGAGADTYGGLTPTLAVSGRTLKWTYATGLRAALPAITITYGGYST